MKKVISLILISVMLIAVSTATFAAEGNNSLPTITNSEYQNAQQETGNNNTSLPQTGVEVFWAPIGLIVFAASAVFAYKRVSYYRGV